MQDEDISSNEFYKVLEEVKSIAKSRLIKSRIARGKNIAKLSLILEAKLTPR